MGSCNNYQGCRSSVHPLEKVDERSVWSDSGGSEFHDLANGQLRVQARHQVCASVGTQLQGEHRRPGPNHLRSAPGVGNGRWLQSSLAPLATGSTCMQQPEPDLSERYQARGHRSHKPGCDYLSFLHEWFTLTPAPQQSHAECVLELLDARGLSTSFRGHVGTARQTDLCEII